MGPVRVWYLGVAGLFVAIVPLRIFRAIPRRAMTAMAANLNYSMQGLYMPGLIITQQNTSSFINIFCRQLIHAIVHSGSLIHIIIHILICLLYCLYK